MKIKKSIFLIFCAYIWTKTLLGLTFRPFVTTKQITRRPILFPVVFSPLMGLFVLLIAGRIGALLIQVYGLKRELIAFFLSSILVSILLWQVLILYLLVSLLFTFWTNNKN